MTLRSWMYFCIFSLSSSGTGVTILEDLNMAGAGAVCEGESGNGLAQLSKLGMGGGRSSFLRWRIRKG